VVSLASGEREREKRVVDFAGRIELKRQGETATKTQWKKDRRRRKREKKRKEEKCDNKQKGTARMKGMERRAKRDAFRSKSEEEGEVLLGAVERKRDLISVPFLRGRKGGRRERRRTAFPSRKRPNRASTTSEVRREMKSASTRSRGRVARKCTAHHSELLLLCK